MRSLHEWLVANKISLNKDKTELIFFLKARSDNPTDIKIKLNGKRLYPSKKIKYLGICLDKTLSGMPHCEELLKKLCRANGMLSKARHYVPINYLRSIYFSIFSSILLYGAQIWSQNLASVSDKVFILQKKAVRIMTFSDFKAHSLPLFGDLEILTFHDHITLLNCLFVYDYLKGNLPKSFDNIFKRIEDLHQTETRSAFIGQLCIPSYNSTTYGLKSIYKKCIDSWNLMTKKLREDFENWQSLEKEPGRKSKKISFDLKDFSRNELKKTITYYFISKYN